MPKLLLLTALICVIALSAAPLSGQSLKTDDNIETDAQLVSGVPTGTPPLAVSSATRVPNLNADRVDGLQGSELALEADLQAAEALLMALQAQVDALGMARVGRTGQTGCWDQDGNVVACGTGVGQGQDGDLQVGVTWPNPRFTNNGDGTVTDNLTSLIWLEDANCFGDKSWVDALAAANGLFDGSTNDPSGGDCDLADGSTAGAWHLPNLRELQSLMHWGVNSPTIPNTAGTGKWTPGDPFLNVQLDFYWTSTSGLFNKNQAWAISFNFGLIDTVLKGGDVRKMWPVKSSNL